MLSFLQLTNHLNQGYFLAYPDQTLAKAVYHPNTKSLSLWIRSSHSPPDQPAVSCFSIQENNYSQAQIKENKLHITFQDKQRISFTLEKIPIPPGPETPKSLSFSHLRDFLDEKRVILDNDLTFGQAIAEYEKLHIYGEYRNYIITPQSLREANYLPNGIIQTKLHNQFSQQLTSLSIVPTCAPPFNIKYPLTSTQKVFLSFRQLANLLSPEYYVLDLDKSQAGTTSYIRSLGLCLFLHGVQYTIRPSNLRQAVLEPDGSLYLAFQDQLHGPVELNLALAQPFSFQELVKKIQQTPLEKSH